MNSKLIILSAVELVFCAGQVYAGGGHNHGEHKEESSEDHKGSMMGDMEEHHSKYPNVGNAICPVSGELISDVGEGKGVQIEHKGKVYNVCCKFCAKDFRKDPEKFIKKINKGSEGSEHEEHGDHDH